MIQSPYTIACKYGYQVPSGCYYFKIKMALTGIANICVSKKNPPKKYKAPLIAFNVGAPFERIALDILGPLPLTKQGHKYLLVIGDYRILVNG